MTKFVGLGAVLSSTFVIALGFNACTKGGGFAVSEVGQQNLGSSAPPGSNGDNSGAGGVILPALDGKVLYANNCAACHGALDVSVKKDRTFENINNALIGIPQMNYLKNSLSAAQLQAISAALKSSGTFDGTACITSSVGNTPLRRLTRTELQNSLVDLMGVNQNFVAGVEVDAPGVSGFSNDAKSLTIGSVQLEKIMTAVNSSVSAGLAAVNSPFLKCTNNLQDATCARTQLQALARRAYRRTPTAAELNALVGVFTKHQTSGFNTALSLAMQATLLSPNFMYVTAFSGGNTAKGKSLTTPEFAARMALFLWNSVPDTRLLDLAEQGTLKQPVTLKAEIARMLKDPRSLRFTDNMFKEWLKYDKVADANVVYVMASPPSCVLTWSEKPPPF